MNNHDLKLAVFDCDGTLVDSQHSIVAAMHMACDDFGVEKPAPEAIRRLVGLPLIEVVSTLVPELGSDDHQRLRDVYADAFHAMRLDGSLREPLFPGMVEAITALEDAGWILGVATGKSHRGLLSTLDRHGLRDRFVTLQTADLAAGKPHPEMLLNAMAESGANKGATVMIGDTTFDVEMARNAGVHVIGVSWGYHDGVELMAAGANVIAGVCADLTHLPDEIIEGHHRTEPMPSAAGE